MNALVVVCIWNEIFGFQCMGVVGAWLGAHPLGPSGCSELLIDLIFLMQQCWNHNCLWFFFFLSEAL